MPVLGEAESPRHIPGLIPVSVHQGWVVQSSSRAAASAHSRSPAPLLTPFSSCRVYPSARGDWLAASTRNPGRGKQTKHRLSPGSPRASARLRSFFPSWPALPRREKPLQLGIASLPCLPPEQTQRDSGCTPGHSCFRKERRDDVPIASRAQPWAASNPSGDPGGAPGSPWIPVRHSCLINALYYLTGMITSPQTGRL